GANWVSARFLLSDNEGNGRIAVSVVSPSPPPFPPCHPGCFPAGTSIHVPGGTKAIERLREGDIVTTVGSDGKCGQGKVASMSVTRNRLIEVRTVKGTLVTTQTQPLALVGGGMRPAGGLQPGDRIYSLDGSERRIVVVKSVVITRREAQVFNLVLGE